MCSDYPGIVNWNQRLGHTKTKINICHHMLTSSTQRQNRSFHVAERTRTSSKCQKMKYARAKRAKILFFIVKYANLSGFCCRRRRGCLSSLIDHRGRQNVVRTKKWHTRRSHWCSFYFDRSQMTSKCGKNKKVAHEAQPSVSLMFLPHFDVICDLLLNRSTATWNLFVNTSY